jgi:CcmD family protein
MNGIAFLKAAYAVAWIVYVGYLGRILLRMRRVEKELKDVEGGVSSTATSGTPGAQRQRA